jgi:hypothetical protein
MAVKENPAFPHHEDRDREMPARMLFFHKVNYKEASFRYGKTKDEHLAGEVSEAHYRQASEL